MMYAWQHMGLPSQVLLACWFILLVSAIFSFAIITDVKKFKFTAFLLFGSAVSIAAAFALFSPYLFTWDEQFHALVGKHASKNPFFPTLYSNEPLHLGTENWINSVIWLHKQPLFTWQIGASIKLFGVNSFAVRFPSVIFHGFLTLATFRIGTIVFNRKTGFIAALLAMHAGFLLGLISGNVGTDHNDFIFLCYITFSFWAWFEWNLSAQRKWLIWIGIFVGCAILTKWLVGFLVFFGWAMVILSTIRSNNWRSALKPILISFLVSCFVFVPWQLYTFIRFPAAAMREMKYNSQHISHAVENHAGDYGYHFSQIKILYFSNLEFFILFAIGILFLIIKPINRKSKIVIFSSIFVIYLFFSLVNTKMPAFTLPVFISLILIISYGISEVLALLKKKAVRWTATVLLVTISINWMLKPGSSLNRFGLQKNNVEAESREIRLKMLAFTIKEGSNDLKRIVFGADFDEFANISWMFFNDEIAYPFVPSELQVNELLKKGYSLSIIQHTNIIPNVLKNRKDIEILYFHK